MKYKLIKDINPKYNAIEQVLTNRGIPYNPYNNKDTNKCLTN